MRAVRLPVSGAVVFVAAADVAARRRWTCCRHAFVTYLENHDQVANSASGTRLHQLASPGRHRAMTAWLLLGPATPMLFQGQEFSSSAPFLYFADHNPELAEAIRPGRVEFLAQFPSLTDDGVVARARAAGRRRRRSRRCKLDFAERERHADGVRAALAICWRCAATIRCCREPARYRPEGAVLGSGALLLRYIDAERGDRLLVVNLDADLDFTPAREPLLAPPCGRALAARPGAARRRATAARGSRRSIPTGPGAFPAAARCSSFRSTDDGSGTHDSRAARSRGRNDCGGRAPAAPRVAGDQRPRRLRVRHRRRHADAALSRDAGGVAAGAARAHGPAQSPARARAPAGQRASSGSATRTRSPARTRRIAPSTSRSSASSSACRSGSTASTASRSRSAS